ncbi:MAG: hypothetical protein ACRD3C_03795 [Vicinamibacterales bacterium]
MLVAVPADAQVWFGLPNGWFGPYDNNEITVVAQDSDMAGVRLGVWRDTFVDTNIGKFSANLVRSDFRQEEFGAIVFSVTSDRQAGYVSIALRHQGDENIYDVVRFTPEVVHFNVPITAPNLTAQGGGDRLQAGRFIVVQQPGDGNLVQYEVIGNVWCARWSIYTGLIPKHTSPASECRE